MERLKSLVFRKRKQHVSDKLSLRISLSACQSYSLSLVPALLPAGKREAPEAGSFWPKRNITDEDQDIADF